MGEKKLKRKLPQNQSEELLEPEGKKLKLEKSSKTEKSKKGEKRKQHDEGVDGVSDEMAGVQTEKKKKKEKEKMDKDDDKSKNEKKTQGKEEEESRAQQAAEEDKEMGEARADNEAPELIAAVDADTSTTKKEKKQKKEKKDKHAKRPKNQEEKQSRGKDAAVKEQGKDRTSSDDAAASKSTVVDDTNTTEDKKAIPETKAEQPASEKKDKKKNKNKKSKKEQTSKQKESTSAIAADNEAQEPKGETQAVAASQEPTHLAPATDSHGGKQKTPRFIVFVGNLPFTATLESIKKHFEKNPPASVRVATEKKTPQKCRGFAFVEFDNFDRMETCLKLYHHSTFDDGLSPARKINVELTAGGGGKSEHRQSKIEAKNKKLKVERQRAAKEVQKEKTHKQSSREAADGEESRNDFGDVHPSRLNRMARS